ncbi:hypothetical protein [Siminovitchia terrae]|uniref:hypothetical protein n=1 Tax=Siminovitchia terrae TaxID=1914933 RepID=UPI0028B0C938|nr:hypothetical protein [Siminovitchia terrae]
MIRKMATSLFVLFLVGTGSNSIASAISNQPFKTPDTKQSEQWKVELDEVKYDSKMSRPIKGENEMYSLKIINVGKEVYDVEFETYRNEPNTKTKFGLSLQEQRKGVFKEGMNVHFANFSIHVKAKTFEVEVSWHDKPVNIKNGREFKQTFTFTRPND